MIYFLLQTWETIDSDLLHAPLICPSTFGQSQSQQEQMQDKIQG